MKKQRIPDIFATGVAALLAIAGMAVHVSGNELQAPEQPITIEGRKPVQFRHSIHTALKIDCGACHHDGDHQPMTKETIAAMSVDRLTCVNCHNSSFTNPELQTMKDIFHSRCRTCHKNGVGEKKGPVKCADCHGKTAKKQAGAIEGC